MRFPPRRSELPAQTVIEGQVRPIAPTVLAVNAEISPARVHGYLGPLRVIGGSPYKEVGEIDPCFGAIETKGPNPRSELIIRDLIVMEIDAELYSMSSNHLREIIEDLVGVVNVMVIVGVDADAEGVETDRLNPLRADWNDACASLRGERGAQTANRLAGNRGATNVIQSELVD